MDISSVTPKTWVTLGFIRLSYLQGRLSHVYLLVSGSAFIILLWSIFICVPSMCIGQCLLYWAVAASHCVCPWTSQQVGCAVQLASPATAATCQGHKCGSCMPHIYSALKAQLIFKVVRLLEESKTRELGQGCSSKGQLSPSPFYPAGVSQSHMERSGFSWAFVARRWFNVKIWQGAKWNMCRLKPEALFWALL